MASNDLPNHWELLNDADRQTYERIRAALTAPSNKNKKNKRADEFRDILEAIYLFENHDDVDKWKRCLVCGVFKFEGGIAVNISALKRLVFKCKSSINGSLKAIGYPNVKYKSSQCEELLQGIPYLKGNTVELRQWTVRFQDPQAAKDDFETENSQYITPPSAEMEMEAVNQSNTTDVEKNSTEAEFNFFNSPYWPMKNSSDDEALFIDLF